MLLTYPTLNSRNRNMNQSGKCEFGNSCARSTLKFSVTLSQLSLLYVLANHEHDVSVMSLVVILVLVLVPREHRQTKLGLCKIQMNPGVNQ